MDKLEPLLSVLLGPRGVLLTHVERGQPADSHLLAGDGGFVDLLYAVREQRQRDYNLGSSDRLGSLTPLPLRLRQHLPQEDLPALVATHAQEDRRAPLVGR